MMIKDQDLISIQEIRELINNAQDAFKKFCVMNPDEIDHIIKRMAEYGSREAKHLAELAVEETGIGIVNDKIIKNKFASEKIHESLVKEKTLGIISWNKSTGIMEVGMPVGVLCGIIPTTNPTSTVIYKSLIALKSGNAIIFSPHPSAKKSILAAADLMHNAAISAGAPRGIIGCPTNVTLEGTKELMTHRNVAMILATGGSEMVKAAYSSGKPALGVGPGNVPVYIHQSADIDDAVTKIVMSKTFDNGTVCSSEQAIVVDRIISEKVINALVSQKAYFLDEVQAENLSKVLFTLRNTISPSLVGRSAETIARTAKINVPTGTKILAVRPEGIGPDFPLSKEKLSPVLAFYVVDGPEEGCQYCIKLLEMGGLGHSLVIHARDESVIYEFALKKPVSRLLVNTPSTHGAIGLSTALTPSLTLGCGTMGGNATSDNISAIHLVNIKRVAWHRNQPDSQAKQILKTDVAKELHYDDIRKLVQSAIDRVKN